MRKGLGPCFLLFPAVRYSDRGVDGQNCADAQSLWIPKLGICVQSKFWRIPS